MLKDEFKREIMTTISRFHMINPGDTIVVGISGGADSMALLLVLYELSDILKINIIPAHVNHNLRGDESMRDECVVKEICKKLGLQLKLLSLDVAKRATVEKLGIEECARKVRYEFFDSLCKNCTFKIATAHTLSDNAETVLLNMTRGTGLGGLCGIPVKRGKIIRPFLFIKRSDTEKYCFDCNVDYVTDSSNLSRDYARNKIRLDVLPVLKSINPGFEDSIMRMIKSITEDEKYLQDISSKNLSYDITNLRQLPIPILIRVLRKFCLDRCNVKIEQKHVLLLLDIIIIGEGVLTLPNGVYVGVQNDMLSIIEKKANFVVCDWSVLFEKDTSFTSPYAEKISVETVNYEFVENFSIKRNLVFQNVLDYDTIQKGAVFRYRHPNDFFDLPKRKIKKKLKKLFNEMKIDKEKRNKILVLAYENQILWIDGIGPAAGVQVSCTTQKIAIINKKGDDK